MTESLKLERKEQVQLGQVNGDKAGFESNIDPLSIHALERVLGTLQLEESFRRRYLFSASTAKVA
ncbi:MAG: hypothetical protein ACFFDP_05660 [Promethearchaeota archaeon]